MTIHEERRRLDSIDLVRGIIMVLMALDHTRDYVGDVLANPTNLAATTVPFFFTRWITHLCAPTFSLLTGVGAYLMLRRRTRREVSFFLFTRGLWLIVLELTIMRFVWQFNVDYQFTIVTVLWALGLSMIALSALVFLPTSAVATVAIAIISLRNLFDAFSPASQAAQIAWMFVTRPGFVVNQPDFSFFIGYPALGWIGIMALGFAIGPVFSWPTARRRAFLGWTGLAMIAAFIVLRLMNGYGDPRPWSAQGSPAFTLLSFINVTKQPPSLMFVLMTIGPALLLLRVFDGWTPRMLRPVVTFGRVPLFYFLAHVLLIHLLIGIESLVRYGSAGMITHSPSIDKYPFAQPSGWPASLPMVYLAWILVVVLLYPLCRWYARVKATHDSPLLSYL